MTSRQLLLAGAVGALALTFLDHVQGSRWVEDLVLWLLGGGVLLGLVALAFVPGGLSKFWARIRATREVRVGGCGTRALGFRRIDVHHAVATWWLTVFFLPVVPLRRWVVAPLDDGFAVLDTGVPRWRDVAPTFIAGWLGVPALVLGPWLLGTAVRHAGAGGEFVAVGLMLGGVPWMAGWVWALLRWDERRRSPGAWWAAPLGLEPPTEAGSAQVTSRASRR